MQGALKFTGLGTDKFQQDLEEASTEVRDFAGVLKDVVHDIVNFGKSVPGAPDMIQTPVGPVGLLPPPKAGESWWDRLTANIGRAPWNMPRQAMLDNEGKPIPGTAYDPDAQFNNAKQAWANWKSKGLSDEAEAAELGNESGESGFNPLAANPDGSSRGINQWSKDRRDKILSLLAWMSGQSRTTRSS